MIQRGDENDARKNEQLRKRMNEKGTHRIYVTVPERIFVEMKEIGLLENIDMLVTNLVIEEILQKKENIRNDDRGKEQ